MINLSTAPTIAPTKPKTKPQRETSPTPRRENDPWRAPRPKVNPTPKA